MDPFDNNVENKVVILFDQSSSSMFMCQRTYVAYKRISLARKKIMMCTSQMKVQMLHQKCQIANSAFTTIKHSYVDSRVRAASKVPEVTLMHIPVFMELTPIARTI
jgi:hypothetical protein